MEQPRSHAVEELVCRMRSLWPQVPNTRSGVPMNWLFRLESLAEPIPIIP